MMRRIPLLSAWWFAISLVLIVQALDVLIDAATRSVAGDDLSIVFLTMYGVYCVQNYFACREVHCAITGPGFLLAALLMVLRVTGTFAYAVSVPYAVVAVAALIGCGLEWQYAQRTGSHFRKVS